MGDHLRLIQSPWNFYCIIFLCNLTKWEGMRLEIWKKVFFWATLLCMFNIVLRYDCLNINFQCDITEYSLTRGFLYLLRLTPKFVLQNNNCCPVIVVLLFLCMFNIVLRYDCLNIKRLVLSRLTTLWLTCLLKQLLLYWDCYFNFFGFMFFEYLLSCWSYNAHFNQCYISWTTE